MIKYAPDLLPCYVHMYGLWSAVKRKQQVGVEREKRHEGLANLLLWRIQLCLSQSATELVAVISAGFCLFPSLNCHHIAAVCVSVCVRTYRAGAVMATCHFSSVSVSMTDGESMWECVNLSAWTRTGSPTKEEHHPFHSLRDVSPFSFLSLAVQSHKSHKCFNQSCSVTNNPPIQTLQYILRPGMDYNL